MKKFLLDKKKTHSKGGLLGIKKLKIRIKKHETHGTVYKKYFCIKRGNISGIIVKHNQSWSGRSGHPDRRNEKIVLYNYKVTNPTNNLLKNNFNMQTTFIKNKINFLSGT